jgi:hypothetical protein
MSRIKPSQHATVAVGAALLTFALTDCPNESGPSEWDDFRNDAGADATDTSDASDVSDTSDARDMGEEPRSSSFLPDQQPEDAYCSEGWCWVHPRPFPYSVRELGAVGQDVYGLVKTESFSEQIPFVWGDGFELGPIFRPVYGDGSVVDSSVGQNGWLALTADGTVFEFNTTTIVDRYELPPGEYTSLEGESASLFIAGTKDGGGYIRRGGDLFEDSNLPAGLRGIRMWPNGEVWQVQESAPQNPPQPDRRRWFELPESKGTPGGPAHGATIGPDPASKCADLGIWTTLQDGKLYRWEEQSATWSLIAFPEAPIMTDFTCRGDGELFAAAFRGGLRQYNGGSWDPVAENIESTLVSTITLNNTVYAAGSDGAMFEYNGSELRRRGGRLLPEGVPDSSRGFAEFWVSQDEDVAMFIDGDGIYWYDGNLPRDVTPGGPVPLGFAGSRDNEIWGIENPVFARSGPVLLEWTGLQWEESPLTADAVREIELVDLSGVAEDDVWLAAARDLFHFDGDDWNHVSSVESQVAQTIKNEDADITNLAMASDSRGYVAMGSEVFELTRSEGSWALQSFKDSPCDRISTLYLSDSDALWAAGTQACVIRSTESGWDVYEPTFNTGPAPPPGEELPPMHWDFFEYPGSELPMVATIFGLLQPTEDGRLEDAGYSNLVGATYLSDAEIMVAVMPSGILARYD